MWRRVKLVVLLSLAISIAFSGSLFAGCETIEGTRQVEPDGIYVREKCYNTVEANIVSTNDEALELEPSESSISVDYEVSLVLKESSSRDQVSVEVTDFGPNESFKEKVGDIVDVKLEGRDYMGAFSYDQEPLEVDLTKGNPKTVYGSIKFERKPNMDDINLLSAKLEIDYLRSEKRWKRVSDVSEEVNRDSVETNEGVTLKVAERSPVSCVPGELDQKLSVSPRTNGPAHVRLDKVDPNISSDTHTRVAITSLNDRQNNKQIVPQLETSNLVLDGRITRSFKVSPTTEDLFDVRVEYKTGYCNNKGQFTKETDSQGIILRNPVHK